MNEVSERAGGLLESRGGALDTHAGLVGLDGFVDQIIRVVDRKTADGHDVFVPAIADLAARIGRAAGKSTALELHVSQTKLGGNGPIMAHALARLGLGLTYLGAVGSGESLHPVFQPLADSCRVIPVSDAARTDALEFNDGKLMLQQMACLDQLDFEAILRAVGEDELVRLFETADLVALNHWVSLPHMSSIWRELQRRVCPHLSQRPRIIFFDLADPEKRSPGDIAEALELIAGFGPWYHTVLGLNEKESEHISEVLGCGPEAGEHRNLIQQRAERIRATLGVSCVAVHPVKFAAIADATGSALLTGPYTSTPKISTGAGDHFNAGLCLGLLLGGKLDESLLIGLVTAGYYVQKGHSPDIEQLREFLALFEGS